MTAGVALPLREHQSRTSTRLVVSRAAVWCEQEWWPFTASGMALYDLRARRGPRALCDLDGATA